MSAIEIGTAALDTLMPMNVLLDHAGRIERVGPGFCASPGRAGSRGAL